jgi:acyl-CoA synthetase (AMP-forming)/AMP-acid ligase II
MGRTDDIINVAGHRLSTGGMEEVLASHPDVAECAVLGIKAAIKGEVPCGFLVLKAGVTRAPAEIEKEIVALVRDKHRPGRGAFKLAITVGRAAEDALGQDPARHHQEDRRRRALDHAGDHRGPQGARRNRRRAEGFESSSGSSVQLTTLRNLATIAMISATPAA